MDEEKGEGRCHIRIIEANYIIREIFIYIFICNVTTCFVANAYIWPPGCSCWRYNYGGPRWWHALSTRRPGKGVQYLYKAWMKMLPAIHSHLSHKPCTRSKSSGGIAREDRQRVRLPSKGFRSEVSVSTLFAYHAFPFKGNI